MFRIWAKVIAGEKIIKQVTYENDEKFVYADFWKYISEICDELDISTPIVLKTHIFGYAKFRTVKFLARDFAEAPDFDKLVIGNITI